VIDCHAHAFPSLGYQTARVLETLSATAAEHFRGSLQPFLAAHAPALGPLPDLFRGKAPGRQPLDIERLHRLTRSLPGPVLHLLETALSAVGTPITLIGGTLEKLLASMERHHIERSVVIPAPPMSTNAWLLGEARQQAGARIVPVCVLPDLPADAGEPAWIEAFAGLAQGGAQGFKIHPNTDGLAPDHAAYRALFRVAGERHAFVILHTGSFHSVSYKHSRPADPREFEPLFRDFPGVRVCLAHMNREHPEHAWELLRRHSQLCADTSWQPAEVIRQALGELGAERLLLGSDWPLLHPELQGDALDNLRRATDDRAFDRIANRNPHDLLGV